tara:strand:+ start:1401 stop:1757 length:357 start_codon:yes stop_codon:yes gene_type:complete
VDFLEPFSVQINQNNKKILTKEEEEFNKSRKIREFFDKSCCSIYFDKKFKIQECQKDEETEEEGTRRVADVRTTRRVDPAEDKATEEDGRVLLGDLQVEDVQTIHRVAKSKLKRLHGV